MKNFPSLPFPSLDRAAAFLVSMLTGFTSDNVAAQSSYPPGLCGTTGSATPITEFSGGPYNPICTDPSLIRYIKVAFHFILSENLVVRDFYDGCSANITRTYFGPGNFTETNDGNGNNAYNGYQRAEDVIARANNELGNNTKQWRETPGVAYPLDTPSNNIRYILVGTYFHRDEEAFTAAELDDLEVIHNDYNIDGNNVLDVYCIYSDEFTWSGIAFTNNSNSAPRGLYTFVNDYGPYLRPGCRDWSLDFAAQNLNHEIGHLLSLSHTWNEDDKCSDTPRGFIYDKVGTSGNCTMNIEANCWSYNPGIPGCPRKPCDEWPKVSNNIMDYNQHFPHAYTNCQISRINGALNTFANAYIHSCNGCMPSNSFFTTPKTARICFDIPLTLDGQGAFNENQYLVEICEVNIANLNDCLLGTYYNSGWQSGAVGKINLRLLYTFQPNKLYRVKLSVNNADCPGTSEYVQWVETTTCEEVPEPCCFELNATNPFTDWIQVYYDVPESGTLALELVNLTNAQVTSLRTSAAVAAGLGQEGFSTTGIAAGNYALRATYNGQVFNVQVVKL